MGWFAHGYAYTPVALRKESVDRNFYLLLGGHLWSMSLSARRAWIEIVLIIDEAGMVWESLSARRAWIEMLVVLSVSLAACVALRKESVDRNLINLKHS